MATYVIGDIQGCHERLLRLLDVIRFDVAKDRIWLVGDLVNRGPDSLATLRFVKGLGESAQIVLGNHDLHLLAMAAGNARHAKKSNLSPVLQAPDRDELLTWLRFLPLMHYDASMEVAMVHAGLPPQWTLSESIECACEVEGVLRGPGAQDFLHDMYGNEPARWSADLVGMDRLRFITNCFTRLRYCSIDGTLALKEKGPPGSQAEGYLPWFAVPNRATRDVRIVFGHWSTLGYSAQHNTWGVDTGCVWKGSLTAVRIHRSKPIKPISVSCS